MQHIGLYWFCNDLRLHDNLSLKIAASEVGQLICVYCVDPQWLTPNRYSIRGLSPQRWRFLLESLQALNSGLQKLGQHLLVCFEPPLVAIPKLVGQYDVTVVYRSRHAGFYENRDWQTLQQTFPALFFAETDTHTLLQQKQLPFVVNQLPVTFSKFRKLVEKSPMDNPLPTPDQLPPNPAQPVDWVQPFYAFSDIGTGDEWDDKLSGGETRALQHLDDYFESHHASHYKENRNALDGWSNSTKFSPWLANGSLSVRQVCSSLKTYELDRGANESTEWIFFELLWREYFQWYAHCHNRRLFHFQGIKQSKPLTSFYAERFQKWCKGNTPYPIVNACMKQLNSTGYMSNRGRQIVASCLVNELQLDWRFGAAYFEQQLIDYDVASNWGNWQYLAGVGADPRGKRHFDLEKQTRQFDPEGEFIQYWGGTPHHSTLDSVDVADWPIDPVV